MRVLSKSRFKLGLECPNKLYYTRKPKYANSKEDNTFLLALADGGFQVEELARLHYPHGELLEGRDGDYDWLWNQTKSWLQSENATIYEAAFLHQHLFIRTDIIVKTGDDIKLIEVKSKSFDPEDPYLLVGKKGGIYSDWKPYLFDIAYQKHVLQLCYPHWRVRSYLLMADKSKFASRDGLNQLFRISKKAGHRTGVVPLVDSMEQVGNSVVGLKEVTDIVEGIENNTHVYNPSMKFQEFINYFRELYKSDTYANYPTTYSACKECEFKATPEEESNSLRSGFKECFKKQHGWSDEDFMRTNIMGIKGIHPSYSRKLVDKGIFFLEELTTEQIGYREEAGRYSNTERAWMQIKNALFDDNKIIYDKEGIRDIINSWHYPLHFIDFETATAALPFNKGMHPYEQSAFQFSHHIMYGDGSVVHANQFIETTAGKFPNFEFIRNLLQALNNTSGTIFRYADHENTVLNAIYKQLKESELEDRQSLMDFIRSITHSTKNAPDTWSGSRDMVDLLQIVKNFYFNPLTKGSNSLKDVLPAILGSSEFLQHKYSDPIKDFNLSSLNFENSHIWLSKPTNGIWNPYKSLPSLFEEWDVDELENLLSDLEDIDDGGAAMVAYGKLQYTDMSERERQEIEKALLKYCELDTLAMVMLVEHFKELV